MPIPIRRIARVVIGGEWVTVADNTFEIEELELTDEDGNVAHDPLDMWAYKFMTENRDWYYGPLTHIELFKLKDITT